MFNWLFGKREAQAPQTPKARKSLFSTHEFDSFDPDNQKFKIADTFAALQKQQPALYGEYAMDDSSNGVASFKMYAAGNNTVSDAVIGWYASQGFIGAQLCGILAQNWLINKACSMPADDAIRKGYNIVTTDGDELDPEAVKIMKAYDKAFKLNYNMKEFIRKGRIFGVRVAMFKVNSTDPLYYEKPFNIDGVTAGSYKGIVQVDPYWTAPMLDGAAASQPDTLHFYEPTWWMINGKKVHRSHLIIFRHAEPVDVLKPQYIYGGVPLTQQIMERVYAAERVSNEAPQLAMSKRTTVWLTDMEAVMADTNAAIGRLQQWAAYRDNFGVKLGDKDGDEFQQFDTSLADFDALIMTQYQLVSAIAGVPATKLMGTSPKGFGASGDYEEASYHELLESIQTNDLTPFAERHHQLVIRAYVEPQLKKKFDLETTLNWLPLDTPTAQELAATNLSKAQTGQTLIESGAISSEDERQRVATDKESGYNEIGLMEEESPQGEELAEEDFEKVADSDIPPQQDPEDGEGKSKKFGSAQDAEWSENDHPRANNGQFGSGGSMANSAPSATGKPTAAVTAAAPAGYGKKPVPPKAKPKANAEATEPPKAPTAKSSAAQLETALNKSDLDKLPPEKQKQLTEIYEKAAENKAYFDATNAEIAKSLGGEAAVVKLKGSARAVEKALSDYDGDVTKIKDLLRTTISIKSLKDTNKAIDAVKSKYGEPVKLKNTLDPNVDSVGGSGYRDVNMVFEVKGSFVEVQINMKEMLDVKHGEGHALYEEIRTIESKAKTEKRPMTKAESNQIEKLSARSRQLYASAWESMINS